MFRGLALGLLAVLCVCCSPVTQPDSARTVAAYEIPLPSTREKTEFLTLLSNVAKKYEFHVDSATSDELRAVSAVSPQTFRAAVWRGANDDENIASAMDFETHLGRIWLTFSLGEHPEQSARFRDEIMPLVKERWPETVSLPIMPSGAIPLDRDLIRTPSGYVVKPSEAHKYQDSSS